MSTRDFVKGATGPHGVYDNSPSGLGMSPTWLAPGAVASASANLSSTLAGYEYAYAEFTSAVSITATSEATANTIVTAPSFTPDGVTIVLVAFDCVRLDKGTTETQLWLYDNGSSIGMIGRIGAAGGAPVTVGRRLTPSAAAHVYSIRGAVDAGTGTAQAGTGGAGAMTPGYVRVTRV